MTTLQIAQRLLARGFSVIPIPRRPAGVPAGMPGDGKVPALPWRKYETQHPNEAELPTLFAADTNIAIITGAVSDLVSVDADDRDASHWVVKHLGAR